MIDECKRCKRTLQIYAKKLCSSCYHYLWETKWRKKYLKKSVVKERRRTYMKNYMVKYKIPNTVKQT